MILLNHLLRTNEIVSINYRIIFKLKKGLKQVSAYGDKPRPYGKCLKSNVGEGFMPSRVTSGIRNCIYEFVY